MDLGAVGPWAGVAIGVLGAGGGVWGWLSTRTTAKAAAGPAQTSAEGTLLAAQAAFQEALTRTSDTFADVTERLLAVQRDEIQRLEVRVEDLEELVTHFVARYAEKNRKAVSHVSDEAMAILRAYSWPGNVRELEHSIERAVAMTSTTVLFRRISRRRSASETGCRERPPARARARGPRRVRLRPRTK